MDLSSQRVLVTGGTGFLGKHVVEHFRKRGCGELIVPSRDRCDLLECASIRSFLNAHHVDVVVHLAAVVGGIGANRKFPGTFLYKNLMMGAQLIEECRRQDIKKFLAIGTICSYPKHAPVPFREADLWNGYPEETNAPYGLAKKMLIEQIAAYRQEFGFPGVNVLLVNLYGPGDNFDLDSAHVIPALIRKCVEARQSGRRTLDVWGTGAATREFLYVEDAARAIRLAAERLEGPAPVNIGTGREIAIADLARQIAAKVGFDGEIRFDSSMPDGQPRRRLDVSRAKELLGFEASTALSDGLDATIAWYRRSLARPQRFAA